MKLLPIFALAVSLLGTAAHAAPPAGSFATLPPAAQEAQALAILEVKPEARADVFALGGIGLAGRPSERFLAFEAILRRKDAADVFRKLLNAPSPVSQVYAIVGLSRCAPANFQAEAAKFKNRQDKILVGRGCLISSQTIGETVDSLLSSGSPFLQRFSRGEKRASVDNKKP